MINLNFYKTGDGTKQNWGDEIQLTTESALLSTPK